jgi:AcrR family transcriptional regulator
VPRRGRGPGLYQHVSSKRELYLSLLAPPPRRPHRADRRRNGRARRPAARIRETLDDWFSYLEEHPHAARLLFRDVTGDLEIEAFHDRMRATARTATAEALRRLAPSDDPVEIEILAELIRVATVGLALWWIEHPEVPRSQLVQIASRMFVDEVARSSRRDGPR